MKSDRSCPYLSFGVVHFGNSVNCRHIVEARHQLFCRPAEANKHHPAAGDYLPN